MTKLHGARALRTKGAVSALSGNLSLESPPSAQHAPGEQQENYSSESGLYSHFVSRRKKGPVILFSLLTYHSVLLNLVFKMCF